MAQKEKILIIYTAGQPINLLYPKEKTQLEGCECLPWLAVNNFEH